MAQDQIEVLREGYAQLNRGFMETRRLPEGLAPDIEFDYSGATPDGLSGRGVDEFANALGAWADTFDEWAVEPLEYIEPGEDQVIVVVRDGGRIKSSGSEVHNEFVHLWTFRDGVAVRFAAFASKADALKAAEMHV